MQRVGSLPCIQPTLLLSRHPIYSPEPSLSTELGISPEFHWSCPQNKNKIQNRTEPLQQKDAADACDLAEKSVYVHKRCLVKGEALPK